MAYQRPHSSTWINFVYGAFFGALLLVGVGIFFLPVDLWARGYLAMGAVMLVMTSIIMTKTIRDNQEADRLSGRFDHHEAA